MRGPGPDKPPEDLRVEAPDVLCLLALAALWGASFLFMRISAPEFGPVALIETRVVFASLFLAPALLNRDRTRVIGRNLWPIAVVGVTNSALPFSLLAYAALRLPAGFTSILNATAPLFAVVVAFLWLRQPFRRAEVIGLLIGLIGVGVLVQGKSLFTAGGSGLPVAAALAAAASYGFAANYTKVRLKAVSPVAIAAGSQLAATITLLPLAVWLWPSGLPSVRSWASVAALGVLCTGIAYVLYFRLIARVGSARAVMVTFLVPATAMAWGSLFLGEAITPLMVLGAAFILLGMATAMRLVRFSTHPFSARSTSVSTSE